MANAEYSLPLIFPDFDYPPEYRDYSSGLVRLLRFSPRDLQQFPDKHARFFNGVDLA